MSEIKKIPSDDLVWERTPGGYESSGRGFNPGRFFWRKNNFNFFKKYFTGVFKWFCLHKKVCLTTLGPSGRLSGVTHGLSQTQGGPQNCLFWLILASLEGFGAKNFLAFFGLKNHLLSCF